MMSEEANIQTARALRLATIYNLWKRDLLTQAGAQELLAGPLDPDDSTTIVDDSNLLLASLEEIDTALGLAGKLFKLQEEQDDGE